MDIIDLIPDVLTEEFVILIDDVNRIGERNTCMQIKQILSNNNIKYTDAVYEGKTHCCVIASSKNRFVCSL